MAEERKQERVFYSWQNDTVRKDNRYFIEEALKRAINTVNKEGLSLDELVIDRDTKPNCSSFKRGIGKNLYGTKTGP